MARTAPAPNIPAPPGMNPGAFVMGGGGDGGGSGGKGGSGTGGQEGANGENGGDGADGDGNCAASAGSECNIHTNNPSAGDPVELSTGRVFTLPVCDVVLGGPMPFLFKRQYSSKAAKQDVGIGHGWSHSFAYRLRLTRRAVILTTPEGKNVRFPVLKAGEDTSVSADGWMLWSEAGGLTLDAADGKLRHFRSLPELPGDALILWSVRDRNHNTIELHYDRGLLVKATDSAKRAVVFRRGNDGRISSIEVKNARHQGRWVRFVTYTYDDRGDLTRVTDADGYQNHFAYDANHRMERHARPSGLVVHYRYGADGRCYETWADYPGQTDPSLASSVPALLADGATQAKGVHHVKIEFFDDGYIEVADSLQVTRYFMNEAGRADKSVAAGGVTTRQFNAFGHLTALTDPMEATTTYERDPRGRLLSETDPLGRTRRFTRDHRGLVTQIVEPDGSTHTYAYDDRGNMVERVNTGGAVTTFRYDDRGQMTEWITGNGAAATFSYDADGNLIRRVEPNGAFWEYRHDDWGRVVAIRNALGAEVRCAYSDGSRPQAIYDANGAVTRFQYDGDKRLATVMHPDGTTTRYLYGGLDRLIAIVHPNGESERFLYNREGWCVEVLRADGDPYHYRYGMRPLLEGEDTFSGRRLWYQRDLMGRVTTIETGAGRMVELEYDAAGQLIKQQFSDGTEHTFGYDLLGRPLSMTSPAGQFALQRDAMGNVVQETQVIDGETITLEHTLSAINARVRTRSSLGYEAEFTHDAAGEPTTCLLDGQQRIDLEKDAMGLEVARLFGGGGRLDLSFDIVGRLTGLQVGSPQTTPQGQPETLGGFGGSALARGYEWSAVDDLVTLADPVRSTADRFEYDPRHRLTAWEPKGGTGRKTYRYDGAGNRYEAGRHTRYDRENRVLEHGSVEYVWGTDGELLEKRSPRDGGGVDVWRYEWDAQGNLAQVSRPDGARVEFRYDPLGRRVLKRELRQTPGMQPELVQQTRFMWDGDALVHEIRESAAAAGDPIVEERTYCYREGDLVPWAQRVVTRDQDGTHEGRWTHLIVDQAGAPVALANDQGHILTEFDRDPMGRFHEVPGATESTPFRLLGQYADPETGLAYNRYRTFDPDLGIFISPDPIGLGSQNLNLHGYGDNTLTDVDPFGDHTATAVFEGNDLPNSQRNGAYGSDFNSGWSGRRDNYDQYLIGLRDRPEPASFGQLYRESHSEFKIMRELAGHHDAINPNLENTELEIRGDQRSCPSCAAALENFARNNKMRIVYRAKTGGEPLICDFSHERSESNRAEYSSETARGYRRHER